MVNGVEIPLTLTPAPIAFICEIVRFAVPVLVMVTTCDFDCPFTKLPKLMLAGDRLTPGCTPVPERLRPGAAPGALLATATVPPATPVLVGA